jgi:Ion channel
MTVYLLTAAGVLLLLFVTYDVYDTILHARGRSGPLSESLYRTVWRLARAVAVRRTRAHRHRTLNAVGPVLLPLVLVAYVTLLVVAYALIYLPRMPAQFTVAPPSITGPWWDSLYFSGITLVTVGYGDIAPHTPLMRLVSLVEGASGFALISLGVTYLITVYSALERKRIIALSFYHQAEEGADAAGLIANYFVAGRFHGLAAVLRIAARDLQEMLESHMEHPVIHFFHPVEVHKSFPRVLFLMLEACAIVRACLEADTYEEVTGHPEVRTLEASGRHVLNELSHALALESRQHVGRETPTEETQRWRRRFERTIGQLQAVGIETRRDTAAGWEDYRTSREEWEAQLRRFADFLGYDWEEITGDSDPQLAAAEESARPVSN